MITYDVEQRSDEWLNLRSGVVTASDFYLIMQDGKGESLSKQCQKYALKIAWEQIYKRPLRREEDVQTSAMKRGSELEENAREAYTLETLNHVVTSVGFITTDDGRLGCSPDGLVGQNGIIEIKCCSDALKHIAFCVSSSADDFFNMYKTANEWKIQVLASLMISERAWADIIFYDNEQCEKWHLGIHRITRNITWENDAFFRLNLFFEEVERLKALI